MFSELKRKAKQLKNLYKSQQKTAPGQNEAAAQPEPIPVTLTEIKEKLSSVFTGCDDFRTREIFIGKSQKKCLITYIDNLANNELLNNNIVRPLLLTELPENFILENSSKLIEILADRVFCDSSIEMKDDWHKTIESLMSGDTVIFVPGNSKALVAASRGWEARSVSEPQTETVVRGPREGFIEDIGINCALLRRKLKNPNLKMERITLGRESKTPICICYLQGIADQKLIEEVKSRLSKIDIDAILESGYIEEMIEDAPLSFFPTVGNSEKPDVVAGKILEGRVAIISDGTPIVLTVPYLFIETLQSSEDYYSSSVTSSFLRAIRIVCFYVSILLPGLYVALLGFHQSVLPLNLLLTISASQEGIPFSPLVEALFMGLTFEILQEAGIRMPRAIGQSISIVGALVIGEASVRAGLVSDPMVIITATTAITTFILPPLQRVLPFFRLAFTVIANVLGLLGIFLLLIAMVVHMCSLRSFGVPYMAPLAPFVPADLKDVFFRVPHWAMQTRPQSLTWQETSRVKGRLPKNKKGLSPKK